MNQYQQDIFDTFEDKDKIKLEDYNFRAMADFCKALKETLEKEKQEEINNQVNKFFDNGGFSKTELQDIFK